MKNYKVGSLEIQCHTASQKTVLSWIGKSEERDPGATLDPYFQDLIPKLNGHHVVIEFNDLLYLNSSTVPSIIQLIKGLNQNEISTLITYNKKENWQLASFKALEKLSNLMNHVTVKGT